MLVLSYSAILGAVLLIATLFGLFHFAGKNFSGRTLAAILGAGCLALMVAWLMARFPHQEIVPGVDIVSHDESHETVVAIDRSAYIENYAPTQSSTVVSSTMLRILSLKFVILAVVVIFAAKLFGRKPAIAFGLVAGFLMLSSLGYLLFRAGSDANVVPGQMRAVRLAAAAEPASQLSTAELWDKLTESRIQLDETIDGKKHLAIEDESTEENKNLESSQLPTSPVVKRPAWIDMPTKRVGNVYRQVVASDLYSTVDECYLDLESRFQRVVQVHLNRLPRSSFAVPRPAKLGIGLDYIMTEICREEFTETVATSVGDMKRVHVLMEFDSNIDNHLRTSWQRYERLSRLKTVGGIASLALGGLALVFGLLKFDTWTRGYYTKRLLIGVPAAIIVVVLLIVS